MSERTELYRHFDSEGALLYVGISYSAVLRHNDHRKKKWAHLVTTITIERFDSREEALEAERIAIEGEAPMFNVRAGCRNPRGQTNTSWSTRIRDLQASGLTMPEIGIACGMAPSTVGDLATGRTSQPRGAAALKLHSLHLSRHPTN